jgi:uncharacterized protein with von Willebrand factor type A (vWA) domain
MFDEFLFLLRRRGLAVSPTEWIAVLSALEQGLAGESLTSFYHVCRALVVKDESKFDLFDQAFAEYFRGVEGRPGALEHVLAWLAADPVFPRPLTPEERARMSALDLEALRRRFEERAARQRERHDGGSRHIGTGGTSPFGHSGAHPAGMRVGGPGGARSAVQVAMRRAFANLRHDRTLDVRHVSVTLRQLRRLAREGSPDELDVEATVDRAGRNAGDIELVFRRPRKNTVKLLLLMDVGGSMTPHTRTCEVLFSAAHAARHFKAFRPYYFHNCPYERLYSDIELRRGPATRALLAELDATWSCIVVGDAAMAPTELTAAGGSIDAYHMNEEPGLTWLARIRERFPRSVWLNPDPPPPDGWWHATTRWIRQVFPMYHLSASGLSAAVTRLRAAR